VSETSHTVVCHVKPVQRAIPLEVSSKLSEWKVLLKRRVSTFLIFSTLYGAIPAAIFALAFSVLTSPAFADSGDAQAKLSESACGSTVEANLATARKALQSSDRATRTALTCLIEAVSKLEIQSPDRVRNDGTRVIVAPTYKSGAQ
jgi:hypothetical protein